MYVIKRNGKSEKVYYDKITARNMKLAADLDVDTGSLSQNVIGGLRSGMTTRDIDNLSAQSAIYRSIYEPDYGILASRIVWNDHHKNTPATFKGCIDALYNNYNKAKNTPNPLIAPEIYEFANTHIDRIEREIDYSKDNSYDYFAFKILEHSYLQKVDGKPVERMQSMYMRVALGIHGPSNRNGIVHEGNIEKVIATYKALSDKKFIHASPTLFNAGTTRPQMSSCFVLTCPDSMGEGEYDDDNTLIKGAIEEASIPECWKHCAKISKHSGGIGVDLSFIRCSGAKIAGSNGKSSGIIPLVKVFNEIGRYVDQGGKRKGAIALYIQPWHPDTLDFLEVKTKNGPEELKARDIFPALWMPDLFFKRLEKDQDWSFFCPGSYPELVGLYGKEFEDLYEKLESENKMTKTIKASELWAKVLKAIDETGIPYMMAKDSVNIKSNQKNIGPIYGSNLCTEIVEYHDPKSIAVCNLASIALPVFVKDGKFDFTELGRITEMVTENLNYVLDKNYSPIRYGGNNNLSYRPIGIGVQGLADVFAMMKLPWEDETKPGVAHKEASDLNKCIFEVIYYHALKKSSEMARRDGNYHQFEGSPASQGILQYDMWNVVPLTLDPQTQYSWSVPSLDWTSLKETVKGGLRNSLLVAPMPTKSTSQILGFTECFEPLTSNIYAQKVLSGDFPVINRYLYQELKSIGKWNNETVNNIIKNDGSVQSLDIPQNLKNIYKTVWEISQKVVIDMAADRGAFIDQSQSMNISISRPTPSKLSSMYLYGWKRGLKTLSYYVRSQAAADPVKFNIMDVSDPTQKLREKREKQEEKKEPVKYVCSGEECVSCGS